MNRACWTAPRSSDLLIGGGTVCSWFSEDMAGVRRNSRAHGIGRIPPFAFFSWPLPDSNPPFFHCRIQSLTLIPASHCPGISVQTCFRHRVQRPKYLVSLPPYPASASIVPFGSHSGVTRGAPKSYRDGSWDDSGNRSIGYKVWGTHTPESTWERERTNSTCCLLTPIYVNLHTHMCKKKKEPETLNPMPETTV